MNVLLVRQWAQNQHLILPDVRKELKERGVRTRLVYDVEPQIKHRLWALGFPTSVVSFQPLRRFTPVWAEIFQQRRYSKIEECRILEQSGIRVPKWTALTKDEQPDLSDFRDFVVVKPAGGCRGALVRIMRRNRVRWRPLEVNEVRVETDAMIVQEYIHTGPWPVSYRVTTVFGEPIFTLRIMADRKRPPINYESTNHASDFAGKSIVASSKGCRMDGEVSDDVIEFAKLAHKAFPTIPVLAVDVIREHGTGDLYALEANTNVWSFLLTDDVAGKIKREFGVDLLTQFGGAKAIARGIYRHVCGECFCSQEKSATEVPELGGVLA